MSKNIAVYGWFLVDFRKAFYTVDRSTMWKVVKLFGCPEHLIDIIRQFHVGTRGRVMLGTQMNEDIKVNHVTKQGCVLSPMLFTLFLTVMLTIFHQENQERSVYPNENRRKTY